MYLDMVLGDGLLLKICSPTNVYLIVIDFSWVSGDETLNLALAIPPCP